MGCTLLQTGRNIHSAVIMVNTALCASLGLLLQTGRGRHLLRASKPLAAAGPSLVQGRGVVAGYPCFVRSSVLEKHGRRYLANDSLVIRCVAGCQGYQLLSNTNLASVSCTLTLVAALTT
jgi:hypothetical protein